MSSLTLLPCGETLDYWWDRLRGHTYRRRFLLTKALEVLAYKGATTATETVAHHSHMPFLEMEPRIERNQVHSGGNSATVVPARCVTREDTRLLSRCIDMLVAQDTEVIAVDDGSVFWPQLPSRVHILRHSSPRGPAAARNTGTCAAITGGASLVLYTDADCIPTQDWVCNAKAGFIANAYIHVQSGMTVSAGSTWFDTYHNMNGTLNGRQFRGTDALFYGPTCNLAVSRVLAEGLSFDESFPNAACEDIDYCLRALEAGYRVVHNDKMLVKHDFQYQKRALFSNAKRFVKQFRKYASAESQLSAKFSLYYAFLDQSVEIPAFGH